MLCSPGRAHADNGVNEPIDTNNPRISGLWNTGVSADPVPQLLRLPTPANEYVTNVYSNAQSNPSTVQNNDQVQDPHWRLIGIDNPANGTPHCQNASQRQAVVVLPPDGKDYNPAVLNNGDWVWWRRTMTNPYNFSTDVNGNPIGDFEQSFARWIGARPSSYHETNPAGCLDQSTPTDPNTWPTWTYQMVGGFYVGSCVVPGSVQLNPRWAADDEFSLFINGTGVANRVIGPLQRGGTVTTTTPISTTILNVNATNQLYVKVRSSFPLQGFAISWDPPLVQCTQPKPYFKVFGNDVAAGGKFGTCELSNLPNNRAAIIAHTRRIISGSNPPENWAGASSQLGVFALGQIQGFLSAGTHSPRVNTNTWRPTPVNGLTFGNYGDPTINTVGNWDPSGNILDGNRVAGDGGKGGQYRCIPDYFTLVSQNIGGGAQSVTVPINLANTTQGYYQTNGVATISNGVGITGKRAIVVDGDVYIGANGINGITYGGYTNANGMPSVYVIARGNIYIDRNIRNLSGVYIAQPKTDGTKGEIITCATAAGAVDYTQLNASCNQSLTVTGAFIAQTVRFLRVNGNADTAAQNELWSGGAGNNIAEIFKSSAELYLSAPNALRKTTTDKSKYDSITSLPPVL